jgi:hypothetical protein
MHLVLDRQWVDTDGMMSVTVIFERGDGYAAAQDVYVYPAALAEFARKLQSFPATAADEVTLEAGSVDPEGYSRIKLRAYVYDGSGHTALQFSAWGNPVAQLRASIDVCVPVEAAAFNLLGEQLGVWANSNDEPFEFRSGRAS